MTSTRRSRCGDCGKPIHWSREGGLWLHDGGLNIWVDPVHVARDGRCRASHPLRPSPACSCCREYGHVDPGDNR